MKLQENYNTASQGYGKDLSKKLLDLGLPNEYLLAACKFHVNNKIRLKTLVDLFKQWNKYVIKYEPKEKKTDVNKLTYGQFFNKIQDGKMQHLVPNVIYRDDSVVVGELKRPQELHKIITPSPWCISAARVFNQYAAVGRRFFFIYSPNEPFPYDYVIAMVYNGEVEFYDRNNDPYRDNAAYQFQKKLPQQVIDYLYDIAATQGEEIDGKRYYSPTAQAMDIPAIEPIKTSNTNENMKKNNVKRITESQLKAIIKESVKRVLKEDLSKEFYDSLGMTYVEYMNLPQDDKRYLDRVCNKFTKRSDGTYIYELDDRPRIPFFKTKYSESGNYDLLNSVLDENDRLEEGDAIYSSLIFDPMPSEPGHYKFTLNYLIKRKMNKKYFSPDATTYEQAELSISNQDYDAFYKLHLKYFF